jgi:hypothetical protein
MNFDIGILVPAVLTLGVFSILFRENAVFRAIEHLAIGLAGGYAVVVSLRSGLVPRVLRAFSESGVLNAVLLAVPLAAGIGIILASIGRRNWVGRVGVAGAVAISAGLAMPPLVQSLVLEQMRATMVPIGLATVAGFNALVLAFCVLSTMAYFSFTREPTGLRGLLAILGLYTLMISFGATFGYMVMTRFNLLIGRFLFLLRDWLHLVG